LNTCPVPSYLYNPIQPFSLQEKNKEKETKKANKKDDDKKKKMSQMESQVRYKFDSSNTLVGALVLPPYYI
jgi:hypothetical protein